MSYTATTYIASGLKQLNGQNYPLVDASAVYVDDSTRLPAALASKLTASDIVNNLTTANKAAESKTVGDAISEVEDSVTSLQDTFYTYGYAETDVTTITGIETFAGRSGKTGTISSTGESAILLENSADYKSWSFIASAGTKLYVGTNDFSYYALCVGTNFANEWNTPSGSGAITRVCDNPVRYRRIRVSDMGDLPTSDTTSQHPPLEFTSETLVVVTVKTAEVTSGSESFVGNPKLFIYGKTGEKYATKSEVESGLATKLSTNDIDADLTSTTKAAQAKAVGDRLDVLNGKTTGFYNDVYRYELGYVHTNVETIKDDAFTFSDGYSADVSTDRISVGSGSGREAFYTISFIAKYNMSIYVDTNDILNGYYAICYGTNPGDSWVPSGSGAYKMCGNPTRVRKSGAENTLPTSQAPLELTQGTLVTITVKRALIDHTDEYAYVTPWLYIYERNTAFDRIYKDVYHYTKTDVSGINGCVTFSGKNAKINGSNDAKDGTTIVFSSSSSNSFAFIAPRDMQVYTDPSCCGFSSGDYYALYIGTNPVETLDSSVTTYTFDSARKYRSVSNNSAYPLPNSTGPMTIKKGQFVVVTAADGKTPYLYIYQKSEAPAKSGYIHLSKTSDEIELMSEKYTAVFAKRTSIRGHAGDQWLLRNLYSNGIDGGISTILATVDIIGVIQLYGQDNFIGGVHGNEEVFNMRVLSDGKDASDGYYSKLHIIMNSHFYSVADADDNAVDRYVEFVFDSTGWTCRNTFKLIGARDVLVAYCSGLFAFDPTYCDGVYSNVGNVDTTTTSDQLDSTTFKELVINLTTGLTINIRSETAQKGYIEWRASTGTYKLYFVDYTRPSGNEAHTLPSGTCISGLCEYRF